MSTQEDVTQVEPVGGSDKGTPFAQPSIIDLIKQEAQEIAAAHDVMIPVKGYEKTGLRIKYIMPESGKQLDSIARKVMREVKDTYSRNLNITMDTMAHLSSGVYVMPAEVDEPVELDPELTGMPVDLTSATFAGLIGASEGANGRQIIRKLFGDNEMAILAHGEKLNRWLQDTKADLDTELWQMGEA